MKKTLAIVLSWKREHNTNLLSCTYFSGIQAFNNHIKLSYGINDVDFQFSKYNIPII